MDESAQIRSALVQAGKIAMGYFRQVKPEWKASRSYVTAADLAVQAFLVQWLKTHFPADGIIAEEADCSIAPAGSARLWTVDPIDGTASFVSGLPVWGVGLGLIANGRPRAGYFYIPMTGDYYAAAPRGSVVNSGEIVPLQPSPPLHGESLLLSISRLHRHAALSASYPGKVRSLGSTIAHMCFVATGSADAAVLGRVWLWDLAPGWALLNAAGATLKYLHGPAVRLSDLMSRRRARGLMICGHPATVQQYEALLTRYRP